MKRGISLFLLVVVLAGFTSAGFFGDLFDGLTGKATGTPGFESDIASTLDVIKLYA